MDAIGVVVVLVLLFGVALLTMAVVGTVKAAKAVAAKVERHEAQARRTVENVALKAKTFTKPGPQGQLAAVRLALRTALDSTRQVLESGLPQDGQLGEALQLLTRLDAHAAELDGELRMLEREPDGARVTAKLAELRERAERITHSAESLRWAAQDRMRRFADDELGRLTEECTTEAGALRHWDTAGDGARGAASGPGAGPAAGAGTGAGAASGSDGASGVRAGAAGAAAEERKVLGAAGRRVSAEEVLGLAEPLARLADRLRKPSPGGS
ncbi:hypothetical protein [Kitasatospora sp. NPDC088346]|uniref:hypothetical protein n=1 Tax=Kitasatospora sp. NPDC088346 TaxID=3364073 RepID=UPI0037FE9BE8